MSGSDDDGVSKADVEPKEVEPHGVPATYKTRGKISTVQAAGVFGYNTAATGTGKGVQDHIESTVGAAVHGESANTSGSADGVVGNYREGMNYLD